MNNYVQRLKRLTNKSAIVLREDPKRFVFRGVKYAYYHVFPNYRPKYIHHKDILFIDGTNMDFLVRYRIEHLMEQLGANGMTSDTLYVGQLSLDLVRRYSGFVFYRNIPNDTVRKFVELAKFYNKTCFFNIDDLVIDTEYTDTIKAIKSMPSNQRKEYDSGVKGYGDMMRLCSYSITTTEVLAREMESKGSGQVLVSRNVVSQEMVALSEEAIHSFERNSDNIIIGYFSGSDTHNVDFQMILPAIRKLMKKHKNVYLKLVGRITPPDGLEAFGNRLIFTPFMEWRLLPSAIRECDINLSPLAEDSIFNQAKSENKWSEAALVQTVTVASNVGAYKTEIKNNVTGILANNDEWFDKLEGLVSNAKLRSRIAKNAYIEVTSHRTTLDSGGRALVKFLRSKMSKNIKFIIPSVDISGGINVIFKHADILRENGYDVTLISLDKQTDTERLNILNEEHNVVVERDVEIDQVVDKVVATHWSTFGSMKRYSNALKRYYLVQGYESLIYAPGKLDRILANATYSDRTGVQFMTISPWCVQWLRDNFEQEARYAPNGISIDLFPVLERSYDGKINILVEGNHKDPLKNIDEAFKITNALDEKKYSISYLSYNSQPKKDYKVDHVYNKISPDKVGLIYQKNHILLKTSLLESFSFPPLEMMATGGHVVAIKNEGNAEYLTKNNTVIIEPGHKDDAIAAIHQIVKDSGLRDKLRQDGFVTASKYDWSNLVDQIVSLYE
jgi:glycosyltransferase involved in cell wall biosynthesis